MIRACCVGLALAPAVAAAQDLSFPGNAERTAVEDEGLAQFDLPLAAWADGVLPSQAFEGHLTRQSWVVPAAGLTTLQVARPLREQLRNAGYDIVLDCDTQACGGFDFRFAIKVILPPAMQVNLGDFRYISAIRGDNAIGMMVSRSETAGFVQITRIGPQDTPVAQASAPVLRTTLTASDMATALDETGRFVLHGLAFETGSAQLGPGPFETLQELADYLADAPQLAVALVGHTDASGSLDGNIALSKRRAGSVLERLVADYGVDRQQLEAQGNGYLSPIASNRTEAGRETNRRVEVIVTSTD